MMITEGGEIELVACRRLVFDGRILPALIVQASRAYLFFIDYLFRNDR